MSPYKYILAYIFGCLAALLIGEIVVVSGAQTTIDAWVITFTVVGQDVGERMMILSKFLFHEHSSEAIAGVSYLVGQSILEEIMKFIAFYIAFRVNRPSSIREIVMTGIIVGIGFATIESLFFYSGTASHIFIGLVIRALGHGLFAGIISLLFGLGYFTQMRWIDNGARHGISAWCIRYAQRILQVLWTACGLIIAALLHGVINIFATLGGQAASVIIIMTAWGLLLGYIMRPAAKRPYGTLIREVDLLRQIAEAQEDLEELEAKQKGRGKGRGRGRNI